MYIVVTKLKCKHLFDFQPQKYTYIWVIDLEIARNTLFKFSDNL